MAMDFDNGPKDDGKLVTGNAPEQARSTDLNDLQLTASRVSGDLEISHSEDLSINLKQVITSSSKADVNLPSERSYGTCTTLTSQPLDPLLSATGTLSAGIDEPYEFSTESLTVASTMSGDMTIDEKFYDTNTSTSDYVEEKFAQRNDLRDKLEPVVDVISVPSIAA